MPEANQYTFSNKELLELLIKHSGVHDGRWSLLVNFGIAVGPMGGPDQQQPSPGVAILMSQVGIQRAATAEDKGLILDAAEVNPKG